MNILDLKGNWIIKSQSGNTYEGLIPGTVVTALLASNTIENPYYRDNEFNVLPYLHQNYSFIKEFIFSKKNLLKRNTLVIKGIDTIAKIYLNDNLIKEVDDVHINYLIELANDQLLEGNNVLRIDFTNVKEYLDNNFKEEEYFEGFCETYDKRFPRIRKAHSSFGWDWGIAIPDMGINEDIYIESTSLGSIDSIKVKTIIEKNIAKLDIKYSLNLVNTSSKIIITFSHEGDIIEQLSFKASSEGIFKVVVYNPLLWYPKGYGDQALYDINIELFDSKEKVEKKYKVGIKDLKISENKEEDKNLLDIKINGLPIFLKGSNFIPMDAIYSRVSYQDTKKLLKMLIDSNQNTVRVWGGGYYPKDYFFDLCDEMGILVFEDFMFACATYDHRDTKFMNNVRREISSNLERFSYHVSLLLLSFNNECEDMYSRKYKYHTKLFDTDRAIGVRDSYCKIFLEDIKDIVEEKCDLFYLTSSPTSSTPIFMDPNKDENLDMHCWDVWHGMKHFDYYREIKPSILSEFGIQSFPQMETIEEFAKEEDMHITSKVMLSHEKNNHGLDKIMTYIHNFFGKVKDFKKIVYLSQVYQALGLKTAIDHMRMNAYKTTGVIYWQLNDTYPAISWSTIDSSYRPKLAYYETKKSFNKELIAYEIDKNNLYIKVSSERQDGHEAFVIVTRYDYNSDVLGEKKYNTYIKALSVSDICTIERPFKREFYKIKLVDKKQNELSSIYYFEIIPKKIKLKDPEFVLSQTGEYSFTVEAKSLALYLSLTTKDQEVIFSNNNFNLLKNEKIEIRSSKKVKIENIKLMSLYDARK